MTDGPDVGRALRIAVLLIAFAAAVAIVLVGVTYFAVHVNGTWWDYLLGVILAVEAGQLIISLAARFDRRDVGRPKPASIDCDSEAAR
jgi:hypothetical protein